MSTVFVRNERNRDLDACLRNAAAFAYILRDEDLPSTEQLVDYAYHLYFSVFDVVVDDSPNCLVFEFNGILLVARPLTSTEALREQWDVARQQKPQQGVVDQLQIRAQQARLISDDRAANKLLTQLNKLDFTDERQVLRWFAAMAQYSRHEASTLELYRTVDIFHAQGYAAPSAMPREWLPEDSHNQAHHLIDIILRAIERHGILAPYFADRIAHYFEKFPD